MRSSAQTPCPVKSSGLRLSARAAQLVLTCVLAGCVTHNTTTGKAVPREGQKYPFADVEKAAEKLQVGLTKAQTLMLLGSPAEMDSSADVWVYLPELGRVR